MIPLVYRRPFPSATLVALLFTVSSSGPNPAAAQGAARPDVEVRCHVFQTARDAPMVPGKRTVIRVYANWKEETGPGDGEEEQLAVAHATVRVRAGQSDLPPLEKWFWRPDWQLRADSVEAETSANHYGWRPPPGDGKTPIPVRAVAEFESPETGKTFGYDAACPVIGLPSAPTLKIDYYLLKVMDWYQEEWDTPEWEATRRRVAAGPYPDGWKGEWSFIQQEAHMLMEESAPFALRNIPIGRITVRYGGVLAFDRRFRRETRREVGSVLYDAARPANPEADIIVGIVPPSLGHEDAWNGGTLAYYESDADLSAVLRGKRVILLELDPHGVRSSYVLTHEMGHFYGLCHTLPVRPKEGPPIPGPRAALPRTRKNDCVRASPMHNEGFEISRVGTNKSETEGNGDRPDVELVPVVPLMDSASMHRGVGWQWITNEHYDRLIRNLGRLGYYQRRPSAPERDGRSPVPGPRGPSSGDLSSGPSAFGTDELAGHAGTTSAWTGLRPGTARYVVASGMLSATGDTAYLAELRTLELREPPEVERGDYRLEVRAAGGEVVESIPFAPLGGRPSHGEGGGQRAFRVAIPFRQEMGEVVVRREGTVLARRARSASAPALSVLSPVRGERWDGSVPLRWSGSDPDGDTLVYDVYHSPDGERWAPLAVAVPDTELAWLGAEDLEAGPSPRFRIVALDGFHSTEVEVPYALHGGFRALAFTPGPGDTVPPPRTVSVRFNREVDAGSLHPRAVELRDGQGTPVSGELELEPSGRVARFTLSESLREGASYEVVLREGVSDRFGNRLDRELRWSFRTHPDRRRPRLVERHPRPGALALPPETRVVLRFDEPMDPETLGPPALRVEDQATEELVSGSWHRDGEAQQVVFTPDDVLTSGATYRVTVADGVRDEAGNSLRRPPAPWTFRVTGLVRPFEPRSEP